MLTNEIRIFGEPLRIINGEYNYRSWHYSVGFMVDTETGMKEKIVTFPYKTFKLFCFICLEALQNENWKIKRKYLLRQYDLENIWLFIMAKYIKKQIGYDIEFYTSKKGYIYLSSNRIVVNVSSVFFGEQVLMDLLRKIRQGSYCGSREVFYKDG